MAGAAGVLTGLSPLMSTRTVFRTVPDFMVEVLIRGDWSDRGESRLLPREPSVGRGLGGSGAGSITVTVVEGIRSKKAASTSGCGGWWFPFSSSELTTAVLFRLMSAATLTIVTTVSDVSFSFCFMLTAIDGTRRFGTVVVVVADLPRLPAFDEPLASLALVLLLLVEMLDDSLLPLLLLVLLFGECNFPPPAGATFSRWPKLIWWVSSLAPPFSRAAARSLEDRVVRIGCWGCCCCCCGGGCCLTCCVVGTTCFSLEAAIDAGLLLELRSRWCGFRDG